MTIFDQLSLDSLTVEHLYHPIGIDCRHPRFAWSLKSRIPNVLQSAYRITLHFGSELVADTGIVISSQSSEITIPEFTAIPMTAYEVHVTVWDNKGHNISAESFFETGRMGIPFRSSWVEPEQESAPYSMKVSRPAQYIRIPFEINRTVRQARVYISACGMYHLEINGFCLSDQKFDYENTSCHKPWQYQTYDVTRFLKDRKNVIGVILSDQWRIRKKGTANCFCQHGSPLALLLDAEIEYYDASMNYISGEQGISSTGNHFGWSTPFYPDDNWKPVKKVNYPMATAFSVKTGAFKSPVGFS